ncbi:MAG: hypothetical protein EOO39_45775, partial [Cytophagaceae bacterium]
MAPLLDDQVLTFPATRVGNPRFVTLLLDPQLTSTFVSLKTDAPAYFELASDKQPTFCPHLTLVPPAQRTYVHIRYN